MAKDGKRKNLGRGLSALLGDDDDGEVLDQAGSTKSTKTLPIEFLRPGKYQPRTVMDEDAISDLAKSIGDKGVLQPLLVRALPGEADTYEIVAGERRWRAAQRARLHDVPVIIKDLSDQDTLEIALIENLQRQDLTAIDEALGLQRLADEFGHTQEELAQAVGKSRSHVANTLRLLSLPADVRDLVNEGQLSAGHARALIGQDNAAELAQKIIKQGLNVRQTEQLIKQGSEGSKPGSKSSAPKSEQPLDADTQALARDLTNLLGLNVDIRFDGTGGTITVAYNTLEQLDDILARLSHGPDQNAEGGSGFGMGPADLSLDPSDEL